MDDDRRRRAELIDCVYSAAIDVTLWPTVLGRIASAFGGVQATIYSHDIRRGGADVQAHWGLDAPYLRSYTDDFAALNPFVDAVARLPAGASATAGELIDVDVYRSGVFYNEWVRPQGCREFITTKLSSDASNLSGVTVLRGARAFDGGERARWTGLSRHIRRAMLIHREFDAVRSARDRALDALDSLSVGVVLAGTGARVLHANAAADRALRAGDGIRTAGGRLRGATAEASEALARAVDAAISPGQGRDTGGIIAMPTRAGTPVPVLVGPLPHGDGRRDGRAALVMIGGGRRIHVAPSDLRRTFGLTTAEARLLVALVGGGSLSAYAGANAIALETVRAHLRKVLAKTGTARQADAIRLVLSDAVLARSSAAPEDGAPAPPMPAS